MPRRERPRQRIRDVQHVQLPAVHKAVVTIQAVGMREGPVFSNCVPCWRCRPGIRSPIISPGSTSAERASSCSGLSRYRADGFAAVAGLVGRQRRQTRSHAASRRSTVASPGRAGRANRGSSLLARTAAPRLPESSVAGRRRTSSPSPASCAANRGLPVDRPRRRARVGQRGDARHFAHPDRMRVRRRHVDRASMIEAASRNAPRRPESATIPVSPSPSSRFRSEERCQRIQRWIDLLLDHAFSRASEL